MTNAPGTAHAKSVPQVWDEIQEALADPSMIDPGDPAPSPRAIRTLKEVIEDAQRLLPSPIPSPHVEFFEGSIRLIWNRPEANVRLVIPSVGNRRSYLYHEEVSNGMGRNEGMVDPTSQNLAHWLAVMQSCSRDAR